MDMMRIYNRLPIFLQNLACSYEGFKLVRQRFNKRFWVILKEYEIRDQWSHESVCQYRDERLRRMIKHCYETVPYYTKLFNDLGINHESIKTIDDLKVLPVLTKQTVKAHYDDFITRAIPNNKMYIFHTSGSTGSSLHFHMTEEAINEQWAVWWRYRRRLGISYDQWCAYFASRPIVPTTQKRPPFWRVNKPGKQLQFSAFHGNDENYKYYYDKLNESKIKWLHGYPSIMTPFASYIINNKLNFDYRIDCVTTGGENIFDYQREIMHKAFGVYPYSSYGLTEGVANFSELPDHTLVVDEDFAAVEFMPLEDGSHEIIGTNLSNYAMPLLRYSTNDRAVINESYDNRKLRQVAYIDGRNGEHIVLPDGSKIGTLAALFTETDNITEAQIYQHSNYDLTISMVRCGVDYKKDENKVRHLLRERIGDSINIEFKYVDKIPRTKGMKLRYIISEIDNQNNEAL